MSNVDQAVVATSVQCNQCKHTTPPTKDNGEDRNLTHELHGWNDNSNVEQPHAYEETLLRPKPAPTEPGDYANAWAEDIQARDQATVKRLRSLAPR